MSSKDKLTECMICKTKDLCDSVAVTLIETIEYHGRNTRPMMLFSWFVCVSLKIAAVRNGGGSNDGGG